ncbi:uncharacterized protein LOC120623430 isoform X2 [Pararge aegeria]|uniref:uncharacterized protein LOC120623430 isoform X2 n=1 Tax=Pararge aegeria TaxID=116150 RepID=UPI0019D124E4|nr:uncharacterized protein LOC120623430 isoform X2 [Pararge aegeria]
MSELKICRICLRTEAKVYNYDQFQLKSYYEEVLALKVSETDELPHYFCFECATLLHKFHKFKEKCYSGQKALKDMLSKGPAGIIELSKLSTKTTSKETDVESPFLETGINATELPVLNHEFNSTDPVEIDSFFINNLDVVLGDETMIQSAPLSKICNETSNIFHSFQEPNLETDTDISKNNEDLNDKQVTGTNPITICELPDLNLESELEDIDSKLIENCLDDNESSSMLYGDLPSISQVFDESNIEYIERNLDISSNNDDIDSNLNIDLPNTSQEPVIEYIIEDLDVTNKNNVDNNDEIKQSQPTNSKHDSVNESQKLSKKFTINLNSEEHTKEITVYKTYGEELATNPSVSLFNYSSDSSSESNLVQTDDLIQIDDLVQPDDVVKPDDKLMQTDDLVQSVKSFINKKDMDRKVRMTSRNQLTPNIHSVLSSTSSQEYFEAEPDQDTTNEDTTDSINQLQMERVFTVGSTKRKRNRSKYPFRKQVKPSPCHIKCGNECSVRLTDVDRVIIHERYWKMDKKEQQNWLLSCIRAKSIRRRQGATFIKNITYEYYITHRGKETKVCQQFLMKTLDISQMRFRYALSKYPLKEDIESD